MTEPTEFKWDVFFSHAKADKDTVREIANRLKSDGVRVWYDEWEIRPGDSIPAKIEDGLEHSRVLVLCMSKAAFGSDWAQLESHTFRFKDPLNHNRRFIPFRLDDTPAKGSLAQFRHIDWMDDGYCKLLDVCSADHNSVTLHRPQSVQPDSGTRVRPIVWAMGSYSDLKNEELKFTQRLVPALGKGLAARGVRLVSGRSNLLTQLAANCRDVAMALRPRGPLPLFLDGKLRQTNIAVLFQDTIRTIPNLALVLGGGTQRNRVREEYSAACAAGIPVLPVPATGGTARLLELTATDADEEYRTLHTTARPDIGDSVEAILNAVDRYSENAGMV